MKKLIALYMKDMTDEEIFSWYERFQNVHADVFYKTVNNIKNKFMPNAIELEELCEETKIKNSFEIIDRMWASGYFKNGIFGELSKEQQSRNYEKSIMWLNKGIVPKWLLKDMMKYGYKPVITYNSTKALTY